MVNGGIILFLFRRGYLCFWEWDSVRGIGNNYYFMVEVVVFGIL